MFLKHFLRHVCQLIKQANEKSKSMKSVLKW